VFFEIYQNGSKPALATNRWTLFFISTPPDLPAYDCAMEHEQFFFEGYLNNWAVNLIIALPDLFVFWNGWVGLLSFDLLMYLISMQLTIFISTADKYVSPLDKVDFMRCYESS